MPPEAPHATGHVRTEPVSTSATDVPRERIAYLDALRAILMLLGIPFHAALALMANSWMIGTYDASTVIYSVVEFVHVWRMPAFFVVAGFFAAMMITRMGPRRWYWGRVKRLGVPLVFGMLVLSPIQWLLIGWRRTETWQGALDFVDVAIWPASRMWRFHLWFLIDLLIYCAILAILFASPLRRMARRRIDRFVGWLGRHRVLGSVLVLISAATWAVVGARVWSSLDLTGFFHELITYNLVLHLPAFVLGVMLGSTRGGLSRFTSLPWLATAVVGLAASATVIGIQIVWEIRTPLSQDIRYGAWIVAGLAMSALVFRLASTLFSRSSPVIRWLVDASLPIYLFHQPVVLAVTGFLLHNDVTNWVGWPLTILIAFVVPAILYEGANTMRVTRFLCTGNTRRGASLFALERGVKAD